MNNSLKSIIVEDTDGNTKEIKKGFCVGVEGDTLDVRFMDVNAPDMLNVVIELQYELMKIIRGEAPILPES